MRWAPASAGVTRPVLLSKPLAVRLPEPLLTFLGDHETATLRRPGSCWRTSPAGRIAPRRAPSTAAQAAAAPRPEFPTLPRAPPRGARGRPAAPGRPAGPA